MTTTQVIFLVVGIILLGTSLYGIYRYKVIKRNAEMEAMLRTLKFGSPNPLLSQLMAARLYQNKTKI